MVDILQWVGSAGILAGLLLMERKSVWAPLSLCVGTLMMGVFGLTIETYGVAATNFAATGLSLRAFVIWRRSL